MSNRRAGTSQTRRASGKRKGGIVQRLGGRKILRFWPIALPLALVAAAIVDDGFPVKQVDLHDASVWITNTAAGQGAIGRFNAPIAELTGGVRNEVAALDVLQAGNQILSVNPTSLSGLDPVAVALDTAVGLPADTMTAIGGGQVAVLAPAHGDLWVRPFEQIAALSTGEDEPDLSLGAGAMMAVGPDGSVFGVTASGQGHVLTPGRAPGQDQVTEPLPDLTGRLEQATVVGSTVYVLAGTTLAWPGGSVDLGGHGDAFQLQQPGTGGGDGGGQVDGDGGGPGGSGSGGVLVASNRQLLRAGPDGVEVVAEPGGQEGGGGQSGQGAAAQPVGIGGCVYAAWASPEQNYVKTCSGGEPEVLTLEGVNQTSRLVFRVNRDVVVLNDTVDGRVWQPDESPKVIVPNWDLLDQGEDEDDPQDDQDPDFAEELDCDNQAGSPTAVDDSYGIRPGATAILPVLENDSTPSCGALSIESIVQVAESFGEALVIAEGRAVQFTAAPDATGTAEFEYSVSDGSVAGAPATGHVAIAIQAEGVNGAPAALADATATIEQGAETTIDVAQNFRDPDLDPLTLVAAVPGEGLSVRADPSGRVTVAAEGLPGNRTVQVTMSDGLASAEGLIRVSVMPPRSLTPRMAPIKVNAYAGQRATINVLESVRTGTVEAVKLAAVPEVVGLDMTADLESSTIEVASSTPGTYNVAYTVVAGAKQGQGVARVDVLAYPTTPPKPVAVLDVAYATAGAETTVAPLANDVAPTESVKLLGAVWAADGADVSGLKLATVHHQALQLLPNQEITEPITLHYNLVVDGQVVPGSIRLLGAAQGLGQPPTVEDMTVTVRTEGVVSVPVLDHAVDPEGQPLSVDPELAGCANEGEGLAFVAGNLVRYQAPAQAVSVQCVFTVRDPDGNAASAALTINARPSAGLDKEPPAPQDLSGRVIAGEKTRIAVPLTGIDPDGDGVLLQGLASAPEKGRITAVGADFLEYEALPGEEGTDTFTYAVEDWVGLRSTATVRVGIGPESSDEVSVMARDDQVTLRPGTALRADVLANDLETNGAPLSLCGEPVVGDLGLEVAFVDQAIDLAAPAEPGAYAIGYTACNEFGQESSAALSVIVDPEAPILAPVAKDSVVSPKETRNKSAVTVEVLEKVSNPSGPLSDLAVELLDADLDADLGAGSGAGPGAGSDVASVTADSSIRVNLGDEPRTLAFRVTNVAPEAEGVHSYAFVYVPREGTFPPVLRPRADGLEVRAGVPQTIELASIVQVGPGKEPWLINPDSISATKSDGSALHKDDSQTLVYTARPDYAGPASITFEVTDGETPTDPNGIRSTLTLLVNVVGQDQQPPKLKTAILRCALDEEAATVDLAPLASVPGVPNPQGLTFERASASPEGFDVSLEGSVLRAQAVKGAEVGLGASIAINVSYLGVTGQGSVNLQVVASRRPLLVLAQMPPQRSTGEPVSVDVLAGAANPVPNLGPLSVVTGAGGPAVMPDTAAEVSTDGSVITVTPRAGFSGTARVVYSANDALDLPERIARGSFDLVVVGLPEPPGRPRAIGTVFDGKVDLQWDTPRSNNADIDHYLVEWSGGRQQCAASPCTIVDLPMGVRYTFLVKAHNEVGYSQPSEVSVPVLVDVPPAAPPSLSVEVSDRQAVLQWTQAASQGSPVTSYSLQIATDAGQIDTITVAGSALSHALSDLVNGRTYTARLQAHNTSDSPGPWSDSVSFVPFGPPGAPGLELVHAAGAGSVAVSWTAGVANGSDAVATTVVLEDTTGGASTTLAEDDTRGSGSSEAAAAAGHTYRVRATSSASGQAGPEQSATLTMWDAPDQPTIERVPDGQRQTSVDSGNVELKWGGGSPGWLGSTDYGLAYRVTVANAAAPGTVLMERTSSEPAAQAFGLDAPGTYQAQVTACLTGLPGGAGASDANSCASKSISFVLEAPPEPPAPPTPPVEPTPDPTPDPPGEGDPPQSSAGLSARAGAWVVERGAPPGLASPWWYRPERRDFWPDFRLKGLLR
ncbi:MAG: fibronectin type III domain-containing protein [Bifidobacteriaceae bacterium]|jgi:hypothetical protein|nr:fibronectin type III domain-containing protein [Bifidobacteriaceae bacterium]